MRELLEILSTLHIRIGYAIVDFIQWLLNLVPAPSFDLQGAVNSLPLAILQLLGYCQVWTAAGFVATALGVRAILMIFGR